MVWRTRTLGGLVWGRPRSLRPVLNIVIVVTFVDDPVLGHCGRAERTKEYMVSFHCFIPQATGMNRGGIHQISLHKMVHGVCINS